MVKEMLQGYCCMECDAT